MLSLAARCGPFAPYLAAAAHVVPAPRKPLVLELPPGPKKILSLDPRRPLLCRESLFGQASRGGLVVTASLNGAGGEGAAGSWGGARAPPPMG